MKHDKNLVVETSLNLPDVTFYDVKEGPFVVKGIYEGAENYERMPKNVAEQVSEGVAYLSKDSAGGRILFKTNSPYIAIKTKQNQTEVIPHMTVIGVRGFDIFERTEEKTVMRGVLIPPYDATEGYEAVHHFEGEKEREIIIHMPAYSAPLEILIGLKKGSTLKEGMEYKHKTPVVFYGSSITQGCSAAIPGNVYSNIIARHLDTDIVNLGFSGSARGEEVMAKYIRELPMSVFVMDYNHNAYPYTELRDTHEKFFKIFREKRPDVPVVFVSRPDYDRDIPDSILREEIINTTYQNALQNGDKNVYFIPGKTLFPDEYRESMLIDMCHPTDAGMVAMAKRIGDVLRKLI